MSLRISGAKLRYCDASLEESLHHPLETSELNPPASAPVPVSLPFPSPHFLPSLCSASSHLLPAPPGAAAGRSRASATSAVFSGSPGERRRKVRRQKLWEETHGELHSVGRLRLRCSCWNFDVFALPDSRAAFVSVCSRRSACV